MTEFRPARGFEDQWRNSRTDWRADRRLLGGQITRAQLTRIVGRAPEVVVSVTSAFKRSGGLRRHLDYISRQGRLELEGPGGRKIEGREAIGELADDWAWMARTDSRATPLSPIARGLVLAFPRGPDPRELEAAARAFAERTFAERFEYVFVRHEDSAHPHVHMTVRALGRDGERLTPLRHDLALWRERFAEALRERDIEAEGSPRYLRNSMRTRERTAVLHIRHRHERGGGPPPKVDEALEREARAWGMAGARGPGSLEDHLARRSNTTRSLYVEAARELSRSGDAQDRALAEKVMAFVDAMPAPHSQRQRLAQQRQAEALYARIRADRERDRDGERERGR